jgi:HSP20 family protein
MKLINAYTPAQERENRYYPASGLWNRFFDDQFAGERQYFALPPANIIEEEKNFRIEMAVPGYQKSDFNLELDKDLLTVGLKGDEQKEEQADEKQQKESQKSEDENSGRYIKREFAYDGFCRSFRLSDKVDKENIQAKYENGILKISIPKTKEMLNRSIEIS